ncbi:MAG: alpha/beta hydrolase [Actinobacteria bacterium]|nr:alpha/beta hydrolase [Actinomycetota bacterium]
MADYVLIHGGMNDGGVWKDVVTILEENGHEVLAPTLTGPEEIGLEDNIAEVCDLITENELRDVILVGHSYGAMVITGTADTIPEEIGRLVYIDSVVPESGKSLFSLIESRGVDLERCGVVRYRPFTDPLYFDEEKLRELPKSYIHCTGSEFLEAGTQFFKEVVDNSRRDNWDYFEIDSDHHCMISKPGEVAEILLKEQ